MTIEEGKDCQAGLETISAEDDALWEEIRLEMEAEEAAKRAELGDSGDEKPKKKKKKKKNKSGVKDDL